MVNQETLHKRIAYLGAVIDGTNDLVTGFANEQVFFDLFLHGIAF